eukprot:3318672-Pyramimonas_sp.AAC.2
MNCGSIPAKLCGGRNFVADLRRGNGDIVEGCDPVIANFAEQVVGMSLSRHADQSFCWKFAPKLLWSLSEVVHGGMMALFVLFAVNFLYCPHVRMIPAGDTL